MAQISVGDRVKCQKNGNTDYDFYAKVEKFTRTPPSSQLLIMICGMILMWRNFNIGQ